MFLFNQLLNIVLPRFCIFCQERSHRNIDICQYCQDTMPQITQACQLCARPLPNINTTCGHCLKQPPQFDQAWSAYLYQAPISQLIKQYKFQRKYSFGATLSQLMIQALEKAIQNRGLTLPDIIIPMPQHWRRTLQRGYNPSMQISHAIAKHFDLLHLPDHVIRHRHTAYQNTQNAIQRKKNVHKCFKIVQDIPKGRVVILDDLLTSGASANALTECLKEKCVDRISVWSLARA